MTIRRVRPFSGFAFSARATPQRFPGVATIAPLLGLAALCGLGEAARGMVPGLTAGLLVAALLWSEPVRWPGMLFAGLVGAATGGALHASPFTSMLWAAARTIEALAMADMLRWYARGPFRLDGGRALAAFVVVAAVTPALGVLVASALTRMSAAAAPAVSQWWRGDVASILCAGLGLAVCETSRVTRQLARERGDARAAQGTVLAEMERVLHALHAARRVLPVCGHCGGMRDDAVYWTSLDAYRVSHASALADGGACPACAAACAASSAPAAGVDWNAMFGVRRA